MMQRLTSQAKSPETLFDVVLSGGSPWGFTLQGGSDFRSKLTVSKIALGGKADLSQSIHVGDEIVAINGIDCKSRAEAIELVKCSRKKLKIRLRRDGVSGLIRQNGPEKNYSEPAPNLYRTAAELLSSDFYSTYNIDRQRFAKITQNLPNKRQPIYDSMDNLSASHEDLLESYRQSSEGQMRASSFGESNGRLSRSSTEIGNGRTSPEGDMLSFVSLPEGHWPPVHERTFTSPGRIQRVTVKSTNIPTTAQKTSPPGRDNDSVDQPAHQGTRVADWVEQWLNNTHPQWNASTSTNARSTDYREDPDRRISFHERRDVRNSHLDQSQPRSRSFGGPTSYGMTVTTTGLKRDESTQQPTRPPARSNFSNLMRDKPARAGPSVMEPRYDSASGRPLETYLPKNEASRGTMVYATPGDIQTEVRSRRELTNLRMTISESTSSIDSVGTTDSSMAGTRRQGPAPPPRRSTSKLLSSFRTSGRRQVLDEMGIQSGSAPYSRISELGSDQPKHTASRSWPTDHTLESRPAGNEARQSWHVEPSALNAYASRKANTSVSSTSSEGTHERKLSRPSSARCSSSVVIRSMRSSSSSSVDEKNVGPTVYRSGPRPEVELKPGENRSVSSYSPSGRAEYNARVAQPRKSGQEADSVRQPKTSRIEDTRILQQLMRDNAMSSEKTPSVKSMVQNFEVEMKQSHSTMGSSSLDQGRVRSRSFTQGKMDGKDNAAKTSPMTQSSSVDSLLEQRSPRRFDASSREILSYASERTEHPKNEPLKQSFRNDNAEARLYNSFSSPENSKRKSVIVDVVIPSPPVKGEIVEETVEKVESSPRVDGQPSVDLSEAPSLTEQPSTKSVPSEVQEERPVSQVAATEEHSSLSKEEDNEVFWDADDSLPPPPPMNTLDPLETSQNSLPLPSPPREVIVEFPNSYAKYEVNKDPLSWMGTVENTDIGERETATVVERHEGEVEKSEDELGEREKWNGNSSAPAVETSTTSEFLSRNLSPADSNTVRSKGSPPPPLVITSTPTKNEPTDAESNVNSSSSPFSLGSNLSTPGSRPSSVLSPKLEALDKEKAELVESMNKKIGDLRSQMNEIKDEIDANEELGRKVTKVVEGKTSPSEFSKYQLFTGELNKIIGLLLSLTQRMHRYEMLLNDLDMSEEAERQQRDILLEKIEKVTMQHEEACKIKEVNDKRGENVSKFLENCLEEEEYADFQYYIDMKTQLALMHAEIRDKVKMGEERMNTLNTTKIDWSIVSLS